MTNSSTVRIGVVGAAGYTGMELLGLAIRHPHIKIACVTSREYAGQPVGQVLPKFQHLELTFSAPNIDAMAESIETAFLCLPHGLASEYAVPLLDRGIKVIDVSADFRLKDPTIYKDCYHDHHPAPQLLSTSVYGLPERYRDAIRTATLIACPGCYPTSIILPMIPVIETGIMEGNHIVVSSMSGVSGAGRKANSSLMFCECNESIRAYSIVGHRHILEMEQELNACKGNGCLVVQFTPHLIPVNRGILSSISLPLSEGNDNREAVEIAIRDRYKQEPFIRVLPAGVPADTKNVLHTNSCEIGFDVDTRTGRVIITSAIDNLVKGASGQAMQCFNILSGFPETTGLER